MFVWDNEELSVDTAHDLLENDWYTEEDLYQRFYKTVWDFLFF